MRRKLRHTSNPRPISVSKQISDDDDVYVAYLISVRVFFTGFHRLTVGFPATDKGYDGLHFRYGSVPMSPTDAVLSPCTEAIRRMHSPERRVSEDDEVDNSPRFSIHKHVRPR